MCQMNVKAVNIKNDNLNLFKEKEELRSLHMKNAKKNIVYACTKL